mmetsp:Transcript_4088/g.10973  ORF Transcript_4088/g.10973 Transcript_4088/m.10973 type:complete len:253 (-) Transcript_4088:313-1071(-)
MAHANPRPLTMTPTSTATATSYHNVISITTITTTESVQLTFKNSLNVPQAKVLTAIRMRTPMTPATGMISTSGANTVAQSMSVKPAVTPDRRPLPPLLTFNSEGPSKAQPPCVPKSEARMFPAPCAKHSRLIEPLVPVIWSTRACVMRLSSRPTSARWKDRVNAWNIRPWLSHSIPTGGKSHLGILPNPISSMPEPATSPMVVVGTTKLKRVVMARAASAAGMALPPPGTFFQATATDMETPTATIIPTNVL